MDQRQPSREGGDIFAADMDQPEMVSKIATVFENTTVFVTGGTGFLGKMFIEKLLRISKTVKVLVLIRPTNGKDVTRRFREIFEGPNMVPLQLKNPNFRDQIRPIVGDCRETHLGLSENDKQLLISEVNYIIHCAATIKFDESIRTSAHVNVRALKDLMSMARKMRDLRGFIHVSTAYSGCLHTKIGEEFYEPPMSAEELLNLVESLREDKLATITPEIIKGWPNVHCFVKAIGEDLIKRKAGRLPVAILRPSIIISSQAEPVSGWVDNLYGITGVIIAVGLGFTRVVMGKIDQNLDLIPADYVMNTGFAALWDIAQRRSLNDNEEIPDDDDGNIPIYNLLSSVECPISYGKYLKMVCRAALKIPTELQIWYPKYLIVENEYLYAILSFVLHTVPAYILDAIFFCIRRKQSMSEVRKTIDELANNLAYFTSREWSFENKNTRMLWDKLDPEDQRIYPFSMENFDWVNYAFFYVRGCRVYLLKDPLETIPKGKKKLRNLRIIYFIFVSILSVLSSFLIYFVCLLLENYW